MHVAVPASAGKRTKKKIECPCKGCDHNVNAGDPVDLKHEDTEIGCKAKQMRGKKMLVPVKTTDRTKSGCRYRRPLRKRKKNVYE